MVYGWISIHRKIQDGWLWEEKPLSRGQAWIDLLLTANHGDNIIIFDGRPMQISRGRRITLMQELCDRWGWSNTKVKNFLEILEKDEKILLKIVPRKATALTIVNYGKYQGTNTSKNITETPREHQESTRKASGEYIGNSTNNVNSVNSNTRGVVDSEMNLESPQLKELIQPYQSCGSGLITSHSVKMLNDYMAKYSFEWVKEAIEIPEQSGIRTPAYIRGVSNKKKADADKPRNNNFRKKETYYRSKQNDELSEELRNLNNKVLDSFIEKMKREDAKNGKKKRV